MSEQVWFLEIGQLISLLLGWWFFPIAGLGLLSDFGFRVSDLPSGMGLLPFGTLPSHRPRRLVPQKVDLGDWPQVAPLFDQLESRAARSTTTAELEKWLLDWSELTAALDEESSKRYIAMTCHTEDAEAEKAYLHYVEQVEPQLKPRQFTLAQLYVSHPARRALPRERYEVFDRDTQVQVELFRPENVPLETEETRLSQQYQKLSGSLTVQFQGEERTLIQMGRFLEEPERNLRQQAWEAVANRRLQEAAKFDSIFDQQLRLREPIARNAGFSNYRDYTFRKLARFDYTPADCERFHDAVESEVMPLVRDLQAERREHLGLERLRPWDLAVDMLNRPPLKPFGQVEQLVGRTQQVFQRLDRQLADGFSEMQQSQLLDLANRKGKAPGGYQSNLAEARLPFIFMNAIGIQRDVETLFHEAGHAFHALATQDEDLFAYRNPPIEMCEVASMSMELLGNHFLDLFYAPADAVRARRAPLENILTILAWIATVDAFQHWVYLHPAQSADERAVAWTELMQRFGGEVDWSGYEPVRARLWHRQLHIYIHPFYYIEYAIAQLGALQVWANFKANPAHALTAYKRALRLGGSRPLPELFAAADCRFDFSQETLAPLLGMVRRELDRMSIR